MTSPGAGFSFHHPRDNNARPVAIVSVDPVGRMAEGMTRESSRILIDTSFSVGGVLITPAVGDQWFVQRISTVNWTLLARIPANLPELLIDGAEGQVQIGSRGPLELVGSQINLHGPMRVNPRVETIASSPAPSIDVDAVDVFVITAQAEAITSMTSGLVGTPVEGQRLWVRITDDGTGRAITWGSSFTGTLLSTTLANKTHLQELMYDNVAVQWAGVHADTSGY